MWNKADNPALLRQAGVTLVELIIAMVIIGISLTAVIHVFNLNSVASADPMATKQMRAVAEGLMDEIQKQRFAAQANDAPAGCARDTFNDILDYNGYTQSVCDVGGTDLGLPGMTVAVTVTPAAAALFPGVPAAAALQIQVTVAKGADSFRLQGWRTDFGLPPPP